MSDPSLRRCGNCARFVRVVDTVDRTGQVRRAGECLLGVWPSPLYETNTCSQWVQRGEYQPQKRPQSFVSPRSTPRAIERASPSRPRYSPVRFDLPEELLEMDAEEFRKVLSEVIREELGLAEVDLAGKWVGGEVVLKPGKAGLQDKRVPIDAFFHKIVMIRDRLRVLEQKVNSHPKLDADEKVQMQQYITACYGSLTTFNILFASREDQFTGQKTDD
jgi:hypothetical protein